MITDKTFSEEEREIYQITLDLLHAIRRGQVDIYQELCSENLTCIEPESSGNIIEGLDFHLFFLGNTKRESNYHIEIINPVIRVFQDTAYISYTLISNQYFNDNFKLNTVFETRIYHKEKIGNENSPPKWKMVHFHRSS